MVKIKSTYKGILFSPSPFTIEGEFVIVKIKIVVGRRAFWPSIEFILNFWIIPPRRHCFASSVWLPCRRAQVINTPKQPTENSHCLSHLSSYNFFSGMEFEFEFPFSALRSSSELLELLGKQGEKSFRGFFPPPPPPPPPSFVIFSLGIVRSFHFGHFVIASIYVRTRMC